ncbi:transglycosylase domain-containing protein [Ponticaulis sp.]|uniref:transglycosylase domain-containing protein n=1 Tax=Ponticaulis sp. TaxID=2020902 RepID=UPI000C5A9838|nr:PBP1A family penicillin-binding protein [Ponticaulis sp.]MAF57965.1 penicillin-binding protein 1A [Ponticaulis sp.]MBN03460.1 penicillin-binding protein 1A [Ponticaulis sp.]
MTTTYRADIESARKTRLRRRRATFFALVLATLIALAVSGFMLWRYLFNDLPVLPSNDELWAVNRELSIDLVDTDGNRLLQRGPLYGQAVDPDTLPEFVVQAFIAAEDRRFYDHGGADVMAIFRAGFANWRAGYTVQGGSTLTQQVIKNLVLTPEQTLRRKAQEVRLAMQLEARMSKSEILSLYLNRIYLGNRAYGIDAAADVYFGKDVQDLTLAEATFLAALPKAPSRMIADPSLEDARERQRYILSQMVNEGFITLEDAQLAANTPISFVEEQGDNPLLEHVADYVRDELEQLLPEVPRDAVVTITLDVATQQAAYDALQETIETEGNARGARNGSAIVMGTDGRILAMVGGMDYRESQFNRATQAMRQPGSSFKPFVYAAAMEAGLRPYSVRVDERREIAPNWSPRNYTGQYYGPIRLRDALANSVNTIAAQITMEIGPERVVEMAHRLGLGTDLQAYPSIALGSDETTLFDLVRAYGAFARGGERLDPYLIERVENTRGEVIYERTAYPPARVLQQSVVEDMNEMLGLVVTEGSGGRARIEGWNVAGKTGTSQNWRDAWFIGFTNDVVAGVWLGNDENEPMERVTGGSLPAQAWGAMMTEILENYEPSEIPGVGRSDNLSDAQLARVDFYSELGDAFRAAAPTRVASISSQGGTQ